MSIFGEPGDPLDHSNFNVVVDRNFDRYEKTILVGMTIKQAQEIVALLQKDIDSETKPFSGLILSVGNGTILTPSPDA